MKFQKKQIPEYFDRISDCRPQGKAIVRVLRCDPSHANQKKVKYKQNINLILKQVRRDHKKLIDPKQMYDTNAAGEPSFKIKNSQIRVVPQQGSKEYTIFFDRKRRTDGPKTTEYMHNPTTLITGGVFPEDAKIGIRYQTEKRPQDHQDVITYEYSGGICPPKGVSAVNSASLRHERANYEQLIRNAVSKQHEINKAQYNYFKASRSSSSLVFSDFLYDRKD